MRSGVVLAQVVHVVGGHQLETGPGRQFGHAGVHLGQLADAGLLHLQVDVLPAEDLGKPLDLGIGRSGLSVLQRLREPAAGAPGETDETLRVLGERFVVHARLVVVALEESQTAELQQVAVAGGVARQQGEMPALLVLPLFAEAVFHHVRLEPDDGLDAGLAALLVELDDARQHPVVGDGESRHAQLHGAAYQIVQLAGPVERRVVRVHVEVTEGRRRWRRRRLDLVLLNGFGRY